MKVRAASPSEALDEDLSYPVVIEYTQTYVVWVPYTESSADAAKSVERDGYEILNHAHAVDSDVTCRAPDRWETPTVYADQIGPDPRCPECRSWGFFAFGGTVIYHQSACSNKSYCGVKPLD